MDDLYMLSRIAESMRRNYPEGTRIMLLRMGNDPDPIPPNTRGTVDFVDDIGTVFCDFDNGRHFGLAYGADYYRKLTEEELSEENSNSPAEDTDEGMTMNM